MRRLTTTFAAAVLLVLTLAPNALAFNDGRGFYGPVNDIDVTDTGFILIGFFPLFIFVMSMLQWRLDKRKDARKAAAKQRLSSSEWHGGW